MARVSKSASGTRHGNTVTTTPVKIFFQVFPGINGTGAERGIAGVSYKVRKVNDDGTITTISGAGMITGADGGVQIEIPANAKLTLIIFDTEYEISSLRSIEPAVRTKGVQRRLSLLGYEPGGVDGNFGKDSDRALLNFQADSNLNADGRIGRLTRRKLVEDFGE